MWFDLQRCDPDQSGPETLHWQIALPVDATQAFDALADADAWPRWFPAIQRMSWLTPGPHGVGSLRRADLRVPGGPIGLSIIEHFTCFERPSGENPGRMTFFLTRASLPLVSHFTEDSLLTPTGPGRCTLDWWVHFRPRRPLSPFLPLLRPRLEAVFREGIDALPSYLAVRQDLAV